ncbi:hypothetical protein CVV43_00830 [Candidatus Saccharibacteria bacterium HGW-Saccharibacteria-1]|nr:MAG: hypothetical protein CVV43_00830 [Candidatus Saccharibacteria bacterium HGW-Saccharibacteria-1]
MIVNMNSRGFTIAELIVVIAVMGILLILGVVNLGSSQANGRDSERKTDAETIALHLETYYKTGDDTSTKIGRYPSIVLAQNKSNIKSMLRDVDVKSIMTPGTDINSSSASLVAANDNSLVANDIKAIGGTAITKDQYVYQPLKNDGSLCTLETEECRKFNIYYKLEIASTECPAPNNVCVITSKNQ